MNKKSCYPKVTYCEIGPGKTIIFASKLRLSYFYHIRQIRRQKKIPKRGTHWLGPGRKIGLNNNLTMFREIQENIPLEISTLILWLTHIQFSCFRHYFKGAIHVL